MTTKTLEALYQSAYARCKETSGTEAFYKYYNICLRILKWMMEK